MKLSYNSDSNLEVDCIGDGIHLYCSFWNVRGAYILVKSVTFVLAIFFKRALSSLLLPLRDHFEWLISYILFKLCYLSLLTKVFLSPLLPLCFVVVVDVTVLTLSFRIEFPIRVGTQISERFSAKSVITVVTHAFGEVLQVRMLAVRYVAGLSTCLNL